MGGIELPRARIEGTDAEPGITLAAIAGVGKAKLDRYGAALLAELGAGSGPPNG